MPKLHRRSWIIIVLAASVCLSCIMLPFQHSDGERIWWYGDVFRLGSPAVFLIARCDRGSEGVPESAEPAMRIVKFSLVGLVVDLGFIIAIGALLVGVIEAVNRRQFGLRALMLWTALFAVALSLMLSGKKVSLELTDPETPPYASTW